jgi:hypothetical protein
MASKPVLALLSILLAAALAGCGSGQDRSPAGNMADRSYYGQRDTLTRPNARGEQVALQEFEGRFIWADYAAPWCRYCGPQAGFVRQAEDSFGRNVVFLTVVTSGMGGYGDPATSQTAADWASRHGRDPSRVLAADLTAMTIPKHILFSPEGHVLFEKTGQMQTAEIQTTLAGIMQDWRRYKESVKYADWMYYEN